MSIAGRMQPDFYHGLLSPQVHESDCPSSGSERTIVAREHDGAAAQTTGYSHVMVCPGDLPLHLASPASKGRLKEDAC